MDPFLSVGKTRNLKEEHNETMAKYQSALENRVRRKREGDVIRAEAYTDKDGQRKHVVNMVRF